MFFFVLRCLLVLGSLLLGAAVARAQADDSDGSLAAFMKASRWNKRVLLVCAPTLNDAALRHQRHLLADARAGLAARDLRVREVLFDQLSAADQQYLTETLRVKPTGFTVLLVGKDGGPKRRETGPVAPASLFATIDAMPMRQREMQDRKPQ